MKRILLIILPLLLATPGARAELLAQAIWCASNSTLYFDYCETVTAGNTYSGQTVTKVYTVPTTTYAQTTDLGWQNENENVINAARTVVFTDAFKDFRPISCKGWFKYFVSLTTITGISNLDTSEVTDMSYMFQQCKLETIDVNTFNVTHVTEASSMFLGCQQLTTIYCNQTWSIASSPSMFENCSQLKGATSYNFDNKNGDMANPINGYFTASLALSDDASNADFLTTYNDYYGNITLNGRTLYKDGMWNTLCLPFDLTISSSVLDGATIKVFDSSTWLADDGTLTLKFTAAESTIEAGTPFIIKWTANNENIVNPTFYGVTIKKDSEQTVVSYDGKVNFVAKFSPFNITNDNIHDILFVGSNNKIGYSSAPRTLRACCAHFLVPAGTNAKAVNKVEFLEDTSDTSAIIEVEADSQASRLSRWYTLDGVRMDSRPTTKGIFIHNGKKVVIR